MSSTTRERDDDGSGGVFGTKLLDEISTANLVRGSSWIETAKSTKLPVTTPGKRLGVLEFVYLSFSPFGMTDINFSDLIGRKKEARTRRRVMTQGLTIDPR